MKHFEKINYVIVQLNFPPSWGDTTRKVRYDGDTDSLGDRGGRAKLHNAIWAEWASLIDDNDRGIEDQCNGFDITDVRFSVLNFESEQELVEHIDWCERQLNDAYAAVMAQQRKSSATHNSAAVSGSGV